MSRHSIVSVVPLLLLVGCKGETVTKIDPQTQTDLDNCKKTQVEKDKLIKELTDENGRLLVQKKEGGEILVTFENNILTVKPPLPGQATPPVDDTVAAAASKKFVEVVGRSRGEIQKCYERVLKKDTSLQARTVTLTVSATFGAAGAFRAMSSAPSLGTDFDGCLQRVAEKWTLSADTPAMTFKAPVSLTPS